ncbi:hypothetical protein AYI69_g2918 [Smittium culicis]|uniref:Uncharacterized protein n=1 Tax=Smittium culicis TaxID=133412 RepID=A0A1R1YL54_9FUNG|nr:hypothetical protein AYI69_g2918 [Smittium culicis]
MDALVFEDSPPILHVIRVQSKLLMSGDFPLFGTGTTSVACRVCVREIDSACMPGNHIAYDVQAFQGGQQYSLFQPDQLIRIAFKPIYLRSGCQL